MTRCLLCGAYSEVKYGVYCEGYPESQRKMRRKRMQIFLDVRKSAHYISAIAASGPERSAWAARS